MKKFHAFSIFVCFLLVSSSAFGRDLKAGVSGDDVKAWQRFLIARNFDLPVNGKFGPATQRATKIFQKKWNLYVDGVVGRRTLNKAKELGYGSTRVVGRGSNYAGSPPRANGLSFGDFVVRNVSSEGAWAVGTVTNNSNYTYTSVTVSVRISDLDGNSFGSVTDSTRNLGPHESWRFRVLNNSGGAASFKITNITFGGRS